jgi:hypothetical protein
MALLLAGAGVMRVVPFQTGTSGATNLGPPMNIQSTAGYFPLSGFRRISMNLRRGGKPELLFIGAQGQFFNQINIERWPVVKALDQFGTLSAARPVDGQCQKVRSRSPETAGMPICGYSTFDLTRARYSSRYISFISRDLAQVGRYGNLQRLQSLPPAEQALFDRYVRVRGHPLCYRGQKAGKPYLTPCKSEEDFMLATAGYGAGLRVLPAVAVGGYLQTVSQMMISGDFEVPIPSPTAIPPHVSLRWSKSLSFSQVQSALIHGKDPPSTNLVENVNAETNVITALICHADGKKPASVCGRPTIKAILRHVR